MKQEVANESHVAQSLPGTEQGGYSMTAIKERTGSCVFLVMERSFRALRLEDTRAALAPLCGTLWRVFAGTASHTS